MLRRVFRRTQFGRAMDVFGYTTHKMLFGTFGIDPAGNVICLVQNRARQTAGSWGVVVHESVSWPLHWYAIRERTTLGLDSVTDPLLLKSRWWPRVYRSVRRAYLACILYAWFVTYVLVKQNAFNQDARLVLSALERRAIAQADAAAQDRLPEQAAGALRQAGAAVRDLAFAVAEDVGAFDAALDADDSFEAAHRQRKARAEADAAKEARRLALAQKDFWNSRVMWQALAVAGAAVSLLFFT